MSFIGYTKGAKTNADLIWNGQHNTRLFRKWKLNEIYWPGSAVLFTNKDKSIVYYWAICMETHTSNMKNRPTYNDVFHDLILDRQYMLKNILKEYIQSNAYILISDLINQYCYQTNKFWWNGCSYQFKLYPKKSNFCGNLQSMDIGYCFTCKYNKSNKIKYQKHSKIFGGYFMINKCNNDVILTKKCDYKWDNLLRNDTYVLQTNSIMNNNVRKMGIYHVLCRNFNDDMKPLISHLMGINTHKQYSFIDMNTIHIWGLYYDDYLLSCVIFRENISILSSKTQQFKPHSRQHIKMLEILFLSTNENVRHMKYGNELYHRIQTYSINNNYSILSVAAVPNQGMSFWKYNGFKEMISTHQPSLDDSLKRIKQNNFRNLTIPDSLLIRYHLKENMFRFNDTPLYAKFVG